jgi:hypothetical protein
MEEESLSSILSNASPPAETPAVVEAPKAEVVETPPQNRDEGGRFAKPAEPAKAEAAAPVTPAEPKQELSRAEVAAIIDERKKRQALEARLAQLEQQQPQTPRPSVFDNEEEAISYRVQEQIAPLRGALLDQSVEIARYKHGEAFADAEAAFFEAVQQNPELAQRFRNSSNPGEFVYVEGLRHKELADVGGDFMKYREKLTTGHKAALAEKDTLISGLQAELAALKKAQSDLNSLPRSLNKSVSESPQLADEDDDDIATIVRFNQRKSG